jgi:hypothetical protein
MYFVLSGSSSLPPSCLSPSPSIPPFFGLMITASRTQCSGGTGSSESARAPSTLADCVCARVRAPVTARLCVSRYVCVRLCDGVGTHCADDPGGCCTADVRQVSDSERLALRRFRDCVVAAVAVAVSESESDCPSRRRRAESRLSPSAGRRRLRVRVVVARRRRDGIRVLFHRARA